MRRSICCVLLLLIHTFFVLPLNLIGIGFHPSFNNLGVITSCVIGYRFLLIFNENALKVGRWDSAVCGDCVNTTNENPYMICVEIRLGLKM